MATIGERPDSGGRGLGNAIVALAAEEPAMEDADESARGGMLTEVIRRPPPIRQSTGCEIQPGGWADTMDMAQVSRTSIVGANRLGAAMDDLDSLGCPRQQAVKP